MVLILFAKTIKKRYLIQPIYSSQKIRILVCRHNFTIFDLIESGRIVEQALLDFGGRTNRDSRKGNLIDMRRFFGKCNEHGKLFPFTPRCHNQVAADDQRQQTGNSPPDSVVKFSGF